LTKIIEYVSKRAECYLLYNYRIKLSILFAEFILCLKVSFLSGTACFSHRFLVNSESNS